MFEQRKRTWNYTWPGIIGVVLIMIAVIQIFRVNPPDHNTIATAPKIVWTEGEVFSGAAEVAASEQLSFPINLNRKAALTAYFTTGNSDKRLDARVIKASDFNMWKSGGDVQAVVSTGLVPRGTIRRMMEPGSYLFILDNRHGAEAIKLIETEIRIE